MNIRLSKVCLQDYTKEAGYLRIFLRSNGHEYANKTNRKIKNKVANFFNESLEVESEKPILQISVYYCEQNAELQLLSRFEFMYAEVCSLQKKIKYKGDMVSQDTQLKLYWSWEIERQQSHEHSQFTRDFPTIETPIKSNLQDLPQCNEPEQLTIFGKQFRMYSPLHRKSCHIDQKMSILLSQKGDSSPSKNIYKGFNYNKNSPYRQKGIRIISAKLSKSADTKSKTNSQQQNKSKNNKVLKDENKKPVLKTKESQAKLLNQTLLRAGFEQKKSVPKKCTANKAIQNRSDSQRRYSLNMNKLGAVVASTVGIFAGFVAGYVSNI